MQGERPQAVKQLEAGWRSKDALKSERTRIRWSKSTTATSCSKAGVQRVARKSKSSDLKSWFRAQRASPNERTAILTQPWRLQTTQEEKTMSRITRRNSLRILLTFIAVLGV